MASSAVTPSTTASPPPPGIRDPSRRTLTNPIIKDRVYVHKYGAETDGEYTLVTCTVSPGGGTPLHYHTNFKEELTPTKGSLGIVLGSETKILAQGETGTIPIGITHRFFHPTTTTSPPSIASPKSSDTPTPSPENESDEDVEFTAKISPSNPGFEQALYIIYGLASDGLCNEQGFPKSFVHLCLTAEMGDMRWPGMMAMVGPVIAVVAAWGRWSGEEKRLVEKYWA